MAIRGRKPTKSVSQWVDDLLKTKKARSLGIVIRARKGVPAYITEGELADSLRNRNYLFVVTAQYYAIFCTKSPVMIRH